MQGRRTTTSLHRTPISTCHHLHHSSTDLLRLPLLMPCLRPRLHPQRRTLKTPGLLLLQLEPVVDGRHMQLLLRRLLHRHHTTPHQTTLVCHLQTGLLNPPLKQLCCKQVCCKQVCCIRGMRANKQSVLHQTATSVLQANKSVARVLQASLLRHAATTLLHHAATNVSCPLTRQTHDVLRVCTHDVLHECPTPLHLLANGR